MPRYGIVLPFQHQPSSRTLGRNVIEYAMLLYARSRESIAQPSPRKNRIYKRVTSVFFTNGSIVEVRQTGMLSFTLLYIFHESIMSHMGTDSVEERTIDNLQFADDNDGLAGSEQELAHLAERLGKTSIGMCPCLSL